MSKFWCSYKKETLWVTKIIIFFTYVTLKVTMGSTKEYASLMLAIGDPDTPIITQFLFLSFHLLPE